MHFYFEVNKKFRNFQKRNMLRRMYQGGSSVKKGPRIAIHEQDVELSRNADVRACEWPSDDFMAEACFKEEFDAYVHNAELEDFLQDKCPQYYQLTDSFVRRFKYNCARILLVSCLIFMIHLIPWI